MKPLNRVRPVLRAAALSAGVVAALLLLGGPAAAHGDGHQVTIKQYMYAPMALAIEQGETVTWTNQDAVAHDVTVTAGPTSFHSPMLAQGASWSHRFTVPGSYSYICSVHPEMRATISVSAAQPVARPTPTTAPAHSAPTTTAAAPTRTPDPTHAARGAARSGAQARPITSTSPKAAAQAGLVSAQSSAATMQPLILVVGTAVAVVLFCLLLMASRPVPVAAEAEPKPEPRHLDES